MTADRARIALIVAIALLIEPARPTTVMLAFVAALVMALLVSIRRPIPLVVIAVLLVGGILFRYSIHDRLGSDVLRVTAAAIARVLDGANPYGVGYETSLPPGAPFPYGPLALAWYLPFGPNLRVAELLSAIIAASVLARDRRFLGLAIYVATPALTHTSVDGSNDTTLGLLLLGTFALAPRRPLVAAVVLAAAVAFKVSAAAWVPAFLVWGGWSVAAVFGVASLALWSPVLFVWGVPSFVDSLALAGRLHTDVVWSLGAILRDFIGRDAVRALDGLRLVLGGAVAAVSIRFSRTLDGVIVGGTVVYLVTLFAGSWASFAYLAALAPLLCLRIDDWVGLGNGDDDRPAVAPQPAADGRPGAPAAPAS